ncbi:mucin-associated surface protein (MASP) [Reticulomyxa filosa]|uniref:Mucin-associated surface protein (MASP) n=1 Tax=Reticulomyxa filosa TaxID=46433 RepID=X6MX30_RETFI|nr:mucin-associated surface protein (MASP) [Reticulomyxa filosa]|eukprot:ETO18359.1 mucin-associated surface protein (MASP) [Reticulomyxa filosa]
MSDDSPREEGYKSDHSIGNPTKKSSDDKNNGNSRKKGDQNSVHGLLRRQPRRSKKTRRNFEGDLDARYRTGDVVWARLEDFPWWPAQKKKNQLIFLFFILFFCKNSILIKLFVKVNISFLSTLFRNTIVLIERNLERGNNNNNNNNNKLNGR